MGTKKSKREQQAELRRIYQNPLPIIFGTKHDSNSWWSYVWSLFTIFPSVEVPVISGVYDAASNSVWIHDMQEARILWERGFFGKGTLSRSEPTWLTREVNSRRHEKSGRKGESRSLRSFWLKYRNLRVQQNLLPKRSLPNVERSDKTLNANAQKPSRPQKPRRKRRFQQILG